MTDATGQWSWVRGFIDELARLGVRHAFVAPGSRNTPLSLALVRHPVLTVHVVLDERVAAYAALGVGRATGVPAIVSCTSGTAAVNFHPAVVEADNGCVPLIVCTADRPSRLRGTGANQTIMQVGLYGGAVRAETDVYAPAGSVDDARRGARHAFHASVDDRPGPVHWNVQLDEPLVPPEDAPSSVSVTTEVAQTAEPPSDPTIVELPDVQRPIVIAGWGADVTALPSGWPVLADPISGLRSGPDAITTYEALARVPGFHDALRPDFVLRVGAIPTGKALHPWLDGSIPQLVVLPDDRPSDPFGTNAPRVIGRSVGFNAAPAERAWKATWSAYESTARHALDQSLDTWTTPFEGRVVRDVAASASEHACLFVGSSMPVRDLEYFMAARASLRIDANRGASGIDGVIATGIGCALGTPEVETTVILGDLSFLHDSNALLLQSTGANVVVVVLDNDGGGIFEFLPPRQAVPTEFETLFGTPHGLDLERVAAAHGVAARRVTDPSAVTEAVAEGHEAGGVQVVVVPSDRAENRERHQAAWDAVREKMAFV